jgi:hypothetical protein
MFAVKIKYNGKRERVIIASSHVSELKLCQKKTKLNPREKISPWNNNHGFPTAVATNSIQVTRTGGILSS